MNAAHKNPHVFSGKFSAKSWRARDLEKIFPITRFRDVLKLGSEQNYRTAINWRFKGTRRSGITETEYFGRVLSVFVQQQLRKKYIFFIEKLFSAILSERADFLVTIGKDISLCGWSEKSASEFGACESFTERFWSAFMCDSRRKMPLQVPARCHSSTFARRSSTFALARIFRALSPKLHHSRDALWAFPNANQSFNEREMKKRRLWVKKTEWILLTLASHELQNSLFTSSYAIRISIWLLSERPFRRFEEATNW